MHILDLMCKMLTPELCYGSQVVFIMHSPAAAAAAAVPMGKSVLCL